MKNLRLSFVTVCALSMVFTLQEITAQTPTIKEQNQTRELTPQQEQETLQKSQGNKQRQQAADRELTPAQELIRKERKRQIQDQERRTQERRLTPQQRKEQMDRYNQHMFSHLNMSNDQIRQFHEMERALQRAHRHAPMNNSAMQNRRNEYMRGILKPDQYKNYETWSRDNPQDF